MFLSLTIAAEMRAFAFGVHVRGQIAFWVTLSLWLLSLSPWAAPSLCAPTQLHRPHILTSKGRPLNLRDDCLATHA